MKRQLFLPILIAVHTSYDCQNTIHYDVEGRENRAKGFYKLNSTQLNQAFRSRMDDDEKEVELIIIIKSHLYS